MKNKSTVDKILELPSIHSLFKWYEARKPMLLVYNPADLTANYYAKIKDMGNKEFEHQIGRLTNFKTIIEACATIGGDFMEFGTWLGFSLLWTSYLMERQALFDRKLVGFDGFVGLPYGDGVFKKGQFSEATRKICERNTKDNPLLYPLTRKNIFIGQFLYQDSAGMAHYLSNLSITKCCFIHIDCDIAPSAMQIFDFLESKDLIADTAYILFDDYGFESDLKNLVDTRFKAMKKKWKITPHSATRFTKNFHLQRIGS